MNVLIRKMNSFHCFAIDVDKRSLKIRRPDEIRAKLSLITGAVAGWAGNRATKMAKSGLFHFLRGDKYLRTWRKTPRGLKHRSHEPKSLMMSHSAQMKEVKWRGDRSQI